MRSWRLSEACCRLARARRTRGSPPRLATPRPPGRRRSRSAPRPDEPASDAEPPPSERERPGRTGLPEASPLSSPSKTRAAGEGFELAPEIATAYIGTQL